MAAELELMVNGQARVVAVEEPATLAAVLAALELKGDRIAVEHNGRIARRSAWGETAVNPFDKLEIVHFVGGGSGLDQALGRSGLLGHAAESHARPTMPV